METGKEQIRRKTAEKSAKTSSSSPIKKELSIAILAHHRPLLCSRQCSSATTMAARQRLRAVLDARRSSQPYCRCALDLPRYNSTSTTGILDDSKSSYGFPYGQILQQGPEATVNPNAIRFHISGAPDEPLVRKHVSHRPMALPSQSEKESTQVDHKPRIRVMVDGESVTLPSRSEEPRVRKHVSDPRPMALPSRSEEESTQVGHKPRIRVMVDGESVTLPSRSEKESTQDGHMPRLLIMLNGDPVALRPGNFSRLGSIGHPIPSPIPRKKLPNSKKPFRFKYFVSEGRRMAVSPQNLLLIRNKMETAGLLSKHMRKHFDSVRVIRIETQGAVRIIRFIRFDTRYSAERHDTTHLVHTGGPALGECPTDDSGVPSKGQREDEALTSLLALLDNYRDDFTSNMHTPTRYIVEPNSNTHFSPQDLRRRRVATSSSRVSNHQVPIRHYATETVSE